MKNKPTMNVSVTTKYPITIFQENDLKCSWATIKIGWDLKFLEINEISKFALLFLERHPNVCNEHISELIIDVPEQNIDNTLKQLFKSLHLEYPEYNSTLWNKEWRKWRYCIMNEIMKHTSNAEDILIKIEGVYADFGYPEDMKHFIYYMPTNEDLGNNYEENCIRLVKKIKHFLHKEKACIAKGITP